MQPTQQLVNGLAGNFLSTPDAVLTGPSFPKKHWRIVNARTGNAGLLDISELRVFSNSIDTTSFAVFSSTAVASGALANLFTGTQSDLAQWTNSAYFDPNWQIRWVYTTPTQVTGIKLGPYNDTNKRLKDFKLEVSESGVDSTWVGVGTKTDVPFPGNHTLTGLIPIGGFSGNAHRFWKVDQFTTTGSGTLLEISEIAPFTSPSLDIRFGAVGSQSVTDKFGAADDKINDSIFIERFGWSVSSTGFLFNSAEIIFDFGSGTAIEVLGIKQAGFDTATRAIKNCRLSWSNVRSLFTVVGVCQDQSYPGNNTQGPLITFAEAVWNPLDQSSMTIDNNGLDASENFNGNAGVRATVGRSTGKYYCEFDIINGTADGDIFIGFCNTAVSLAAPNPASDPNYAIGWRNNGTTFAGGGFVSLSGDDFSSGDCLGIVNDITSRQAWLRINSLDWIGHGNPTNGTSPTITYVTSGPLFPCYTTDNQSGLKKVRLLAGASVIRFTTPMSCPPWSPL